MWFCGNLPRNHLPQLDPPRLELGALDLGEYPPMQVLGDLRHIGEGRPIRDVLMGGKLDAVDLLPAEPPGDFEPVAAGDEHDAAGDRLDSDRVEEP